MRSNLWWGLFVVALLANASAQAPSVRPVPTAPETHASATPQPAGAALLPPWAVTKDGKPLPPYDGHGTPATPPPPGLYVAMGDSITFGVGVKPSCAPFPAHPVDVDAFCPKGGSYAVQVARELRKQGVAGHFMNLGISGAHVERVLAEELPYLPANATLVTLYIGTNDSRVVKNPKHTVAEVADQFEAHFDQLLAAIHERAPQARVVLLNFPNEQYLAATYDVPAEILPLYSAESQVLASFIDGHYPTEAVVDTICNPDSYDTELLYKGGVHPNDTGATLLAQNVLKVIRDPRPSAPPANCPWFHASEAAKLRAMPAPAVPEASGNAR